MKLSMITLRDGCDIAYRFDGPDHGPVLLLSNSLGTDLAMWEPQARAFASRFRILRYDSRGHGASHAPPGPYALERLARDVVELLDALELTRVHFCGLSMGGMVGQWLGANAAARIERLVLANTAPFMGPPAAWQERIERVLDEGMGAVAEGSIARWFTPSFAASSPGVVAAMRSTLIATSVQGYAGCCAALRDMDLRPLSASIHAPTLLITGAHDPSTPPARAQELADALHGSPRIVTLDAAHLSNVEQPTAFTEAVLEFLR